jgi:hypothetical protein
MFCFSLVSGNLLIPRLPMSQIMSQIRPQTRLFQPDLLDFWAAKRFIGNLGRNKRTAPREALKVEAARIKVYLLGGLFFASPPLVNLSK